MNRCFNWKVLAALAVAGVGLFLINPTLALAALPLLLFAACPLAMFFMMRNMQNMGGMQRSQDTHSGQQASQPMGPTDPLPTPQSTGVSAALTREEQLALLQAQFETLSVQQEALSRQLEQLNAAKQIATPSEADPDIHASAAPSSSVVEEAEEVAQAADGRRSVATERS